SWACVSCVRQVHLLTTTVFSVAPTMREDAKKPGVCPQLQADLNCTQECLSDAQCAGNLKCCQAGCATRCHLPNGNPGAPRAGRGRALWAGGGGAPPLPFSRGWVSLCWEVKKQGTCPKVSTDFPQLGLCQDQFPSIHCRGLGNSRPSGCGTQGWEICL
uniref:WAP four-disulfide core domain protein 2 n=1 Tax=Ursus maritimus TaxID=29073 RepID=A0A452VMM7_URSMA